MLTDLAMTLAPTTTRPAKTPIFDRPETIFGVCEALGDDFGISGNWFRAAVFPLLVWQPLWTVVGYLVLAGIVLASRLIFPDVRADVAAAAVPTGKAAPVEDEMRLAA